AIDDQCAAMLCQHFALDKAGGEAAVAIQQPFHEIVRAMDFGPINRRLADQDAQLASGRKRRVHSADAANEVLIDGPIASGAGLDPLPPNLSEFGIRDIAAADEPIHESLVP